MPRFAKHQWRASKGGANGGANDSSRKDASISVYSVPTQYFSEVIAKLQEMQELRGWTQTMEKEPKHGGEYEQWDYSRSSHTASLHVYNDKLGNEWPDRHRARVCRKMPKGVLRDDDFENRRSKGAQRGYRSMVVLSGVSTFGAEVHDFLYSWYAILKRPDRETPDDAKLKQVMMDSTIWRLFGACDRSPPGRETSAGLSQGKWRPKPSPQSEDLPDCSTVGGAHDLTPLPEGCWWVTSPGVRIQKGVDLNSKAAGKLKEGQVCSQAAGSTLILILDEKSNLWHLRMPLDGGGWVTLAMQRNSSSPIQTHFQNPAVNLNGAFQAAEHFDELLLKTQDAWSWFTHQQHLLRYNGDKRSMEERNSARLIALEMARQICSSHLAHQCRLEGWRSGSGKREEVVDMMHQRVSDLEFGVQLDISKEAANLEELLKTVRRTRCTLRKADHELEYADVEFEHEHVNVDHLESQRAQAKVDARAAAKKYREQLVHFRHLVDVHAPEEFHCLALCELDFIQSELEKASPSLRAQIMRIFDKQRAIVDFDNGPEDMRVISSHGNCHVVYETTLDGKPCVLKRISLGSKDGLARLIKEMKYMVKLAHCDLTVPIQCAFRDRDWGYLQFERYECDLLQWMELQQPSHENWPKAFGIVKRMIQAVGWVHSQNVVHGDVKPANFLVDSKTGYPRLHDFETAMELQDELGYDKLAHAQSSWTTIARGTPRYEAPEIKADRDFPRSKCTDVFALGVCIQDVIEFLLPPSLPESDRLWNLVSLLTCESPSDRPSMQQIEEHWVDLFPGNEQKSIHHLSAEQAEDRCRHLFNNSGYVRETIECSQVLFTQDACSPVFSDGTSLETLIRAIVKDPSYPLAHDSLILDVVIFRDQRVRPPRTYLHSVHNRRLYCFKEAQRRLKKDVKICIRKYDFGPMFHQFLGHFDTRSQGKRIKIRNSYRDARSALPKKQAHTPSD